MNDPQIWTLIGVFAAAMLGGFTLVVASLSRVIRAENKALRGKLIAELSSFRGEVSADLGHLRGDVAALRTRVDHLDRDVQVIADRLWRGDRDTP